MANPNERKPIPNQGDCYTSSLQNARELAQIKADVEAGSTDAAARRVYDGYGLRDDIFVVHGWVTSPEGRDAGRRMHHAWIEVGEAVIETQGGMQEALPDWKYYKTFAAFPNQRYSLTEAEALARESGWATAWKGQGEDSPPGERQERLSRFFGQNLEWLACRSRRRRANNGTAPTLEQVRKMIEAWAAHYPSEIEMVWVFGSRAKQAPSSSCSDWDVAVRPKGATPDEKERFVFDWLDFWANELEILCHWRMDVQIENPPRTPRVSDGVQEHGIIIFPQERALTSPA